MFLKSNAKVFCFPSASTKNETPIIDYVQDIFLTLLILSMSMTYVTKNQPTCNLYSGRHRKKGGSRLASFIRHSTVCYCSRKFDSILQGLKKVSYCSLGQVDFLGREVKH